MSAVKPQITIGVVGGGFAGAAFALHLMRHHQDLPVRIKMIEPRPLLGAGLAYSTDDPAHRINVAAARMAVMAEDPTHFDRWFHESGEAAADPAAMTEDGRAFARRAAFGRYVDQLVRDTARKHGAAAFEHIRAEVRRIEPIGEMYRIEFRSEPAIEVDIVVLAPGNPPPASPGWASASIAAHPRFIVDPWSPDALHPIRPADDVLIVGTGLTMADVVASLRRRGHFGSITAISRRGLLSRSRTLLPVEAFGDFSQNPATSASQILRRVRATIREAARRGRPWEDVIDSIRQQGTTIWQALPLAERRRLLRHARPYWDSHRYQIAPQLDDLLSTERNEGRLCVQAARIRAVSLFQGAFHVRLQARGSKAPSNVERFFDAVVNCTGPNHTEIIDSNPALASLKGQGILQGDGLGLGIAVDLQGRVIDRHGSANASLFVAGPLARGTFGELMGLPQVSTQPELVAKQVGMLIQQRLSDVEPETLARPA